MFGVIATFWVKFNPHTIGSGCCPWVSDAAAQAANPLVVEGQKLIPSVTRVFSKSRDLFVYLQAYERNAATTQPLIAFVTFYRGQSKAFETTPIEVVDGLDPKSKAVPLIVGLLLGAGADPGAGIGRLDMQNLAPNHQPS